VQPRVVELLFHLAERHDRAVDTDELQDAVWPGMFITETALTRLANSTVRPGKSRQLIGQLFIQLVIK
jgi:DNA-binding winged helix-turn-helix (wHTH) protein